MAIRAVANLRPQIAKRRSTRIALDTSIGLSGEDSQKCPFNMPAKATNLNKHGAAIRFPRQLLVGSVINVRNTRGTQVLARVVAQLAASQGISVYGVEFVEHGEVENSFWGISTLQRAWPRTSSYWDAIMNCSAAE